MERVQVERIAIVTLVVVAFSVGIRTYRETKGEPKKSTEKVKVSQSNSATSSSPPLATKIQSPSVIYTGEVFRDPLQSLIGMKEEPVQQPEQEEEVCLPAMSVQGIIWGAESPQAIIDDRVIKKGDLISEAEIVDINREGVHLLYKEREFIIKPQSVR